MAVGAPTGRASNNCYHKFNEPSLRPLFQRPPPFLTL
jgi:hypothetical protein